MAYVHNHTIAKQAIEAAVMAYRQPSGRTLQPRDVPEDREHLARELGLLLSAEIQTRRGFTSNRCEMQFDAEDDSLAITMDVRGETVTVTHYWLVPADLTVPDE